jgi:hypothetical protein
LAPDGSPRFTNRLFLVASPYLRQHAHNPVNWYPWGDEAFEAARRLERPVLLSVGYSTCHWCHVMEEESFEDLEIAKYLNENYIAVKVDREERPDVDGVYMTAVQLLTGRGGWPMTVWLTPDRKPFFGGTYFPPRDGVRGAPAGFLTLLRELRRAYDQEPTRVAQATSQIVDAIRRNLSPDSTAGGTPGADVLGAAFRAYRERFDSANGGLAGAPKFPSSLPVRFLFRYARRTGDEEARRMAVLTLEKMAAGGLRDQVGGGFHRYSTDARWLVPHFEKMLYDNALLTIAYLDGYQATGRAAFAGEAREILRYADRDMSAPGGGFYSATDADSPAPDGRREEGWFFTWTPQEIDRALPPAQAMLVRAYYGVTAGGNFEGRNILFAPRPLEEVAREIGMSAEKARALLAEARALLYAARAKRAPPHRDEKILAAWNGLMISAFARGASVLGDGAYARRAARAADFVLARMRRGGRLLRSWKDGAAGPEAFLDDYAFLIAGLLDLFEATGEPRWLGEAIALDATLAARYEDSKGGYFMTGAAQEELLAREKPAYDGAEPSGNSVQAMNLYRLYELTSDDRYRVRGDHTLAAFGRRLRESPTAMPEILLALDFCLGEPKEIVIVAPRSRADAEPFLAALRRTYVPNHVLVVAVEGVDLAAQEKRVRLLEGKTALRGKATAYVCVAGVCALPTSDPAVFARQIR